MKIWILNHYAVSPYSVGGTRHFDLAGQLVKRGHSVRIFAASYNHFSRCETIQYDHGEYYKEQNIEGVHFTWLKTPPYRNFVQRIINIGFFSLRLNRILKSYLSHELPDLIIGSSVHPLTPLIGIKYAKKAGCLFYFEERDLWPQTFVDFNKLSERNMLAQALFAMESYLYKQSDKVIFLFEKAHEYAFQRGLEQGKNLYIPNGFHNGILPEKEGLGLIGKILQPLKEKKICVYIGSMGEANHMLPLIDMAEAMSENEEFRFLFIGDGPLKPSLMKRVEEKKLSNVTFEDPIPKALVPELLSRCDYGLISMKDSPLYKWGFSMNKIFDYLSAGLPILMYTNMEKIGTLEKTEAIMKSNSIPELKGQLLNHHEYDREAIRKFAKKHYSWEVLANTLLNEAEKDINRKDELISV